VKVIVTIKSIYHLLFKLIIRKIQESTVAGNTFYHYKQTFCQHSCVYIAINHLPIQEKRICYNNSATADNRDVSMVLLYYSIAS